jgi:hypothetical protein
MAWCIASSLLGRSPASAAGAAEPWLNLGVPVLAEPDMDHGVQFDAVRRHPCLALQFVKEAQAADVDTPVHILSRGRDLEMVGEIG